MKWVILSRLVTVAILSFGVYYLWRAAVDWSLLAKLAALPCALMLHTNCAATQIWCLSASVVGCLVTSSTRQNPRFCLWVGGMLRLRTPSSVVPVNVLDTLVSLSKLVIQTQPYLPTTRNKRWSWKMEHTTTIFN